MDSKLNPFQPGAGTQPPELAGRDQILHDAEVALGRIKLGRSTRSQMLLGLRGVGKTVLLNRIDEIARDLGCETVVVEVIEQRQIAQLLVQPLRSLLLRLNRVEQAKQLARRGLGVLRSFASVFKVEVGDVGFGVQAELGTADSGDLGSDLTELLLAVASAGKSAGHPAVLLIDELQYLSGDELGALITAIHKVNQKSLPFLLFGAGLPQLAGLAGDAKSYAERLFDYVAVGQLPPEAASDAIRTPIRNEGVDILDAALDLIRDETQGYPYFLQEWGYHAWDEAKASPITLDDAQRASGKAITKLDRSFFRVRLDRLTPREREYMRAMAALGPGPHRSGDVADELRVSVTAAGPLRKGLIKKGMIYSPKHGTTAFTVPMFDEFMRRIMPDWPPKSFADPDEPADEGRRRPRR